MIFRFTMNMESGRGAGVHQVYGEHPAKSVEELAKIMDGRDFILVTQYYLRGGSNLEDKGPMLLNCAHIGKVDRFIHYGAGDEE